MNRREKVLSRLSVPTQVGIEFGPLDQPFVGKSMGPIYYIDHKSGETTRKEMRESGVTIPINIEDIVDVDFIWDGRPLAQIVPEELRFDYAIASHVIEHVPDLIRWLQDVASVLKDEGVFSLVIPDKRFSWDYLRPLTTMAEVVNAYLLEAKVSLPKSVYESVALTVEVDANALWQGNIDENALRDGLNQRVRRSYAVARDIVNDKLYYHCHNWVFTPRSFFELLDNIIRLDLLDFRVVDFHPTEPNTMEFFVSLQKMPMMDTVARRNIQLESLPGNLSDVFKPASQAV